MLLLKTVYDLTVAHAVFQRAALEEAPVNEWQIETWMYTHGQIWPLCSDCWTSVPIIT